MIIATYGHARQAIVYAMMVDYFRYRGYEVKYVRNYTDVDDKIIKRANELGKNALEFSKEQIEETEIDMNGLHITEADIKTKASEYIEKMIKFIEKLIENGYAYPTESGDVYYRVRKFKTYGKLSNRNIDELVNGVRIEVGEEKEDQVLQVTTSPPVEILPAHSSSLIYLTIHFYDDATDIPPTNTLNFTCSIRYIQKTS